VRAERGGRVPSSLVPVEPLAGLLAEVAGLDLPFEQVGGLVPVTKFLVEGLGRVQADVEADVVGQLQGPPSGRSSRVPSRGRCRPSSPPPRRRRGWPRLFRASRRRSPRAPRPVRCRYPSSPCRRRPRVDRVGPVRHHPDLAERIPECGGSAVRGPGSDRGALPWEPARQRASVGRASDAPYRLCRRGRNAGVWQRYSRRTCRAKQ
jgi:hypothetical protein